MKKLSSKQLDRVSDKTFDLINIAAGALIFGQFLSGRVNWHLLLLGILILFIGYFFATRLTRNYY